MIKQKIILIYIIINLVVIISVLGVGIAIFKQGNGVKQNKPTQEAEITDEELAKINDIKLDKQSTTGDDIQPNQVDPNIAEMGGVDLKTFDINLNDKVVLVVVDDNNNKYSTNKGENQDAHTIIKSSSSSEVLLEQVPPSSKNIINTSLDNNPQEERLDNDDNIWGDNNSNKRSEERRVGKEC